MRLMRNSLLLATQKERASQETHHCYIWSRDSYHHMAPCNGSDWLAWEIPSCELNAIPTVNARGGDLLGSWINKCFFKCNQ